MTLAITRTPWKNGMTPDEDDFEALFVELESEANGANVDPGKLTQPYSTTIVPIFLPALATSGSVVWKSTPDFAGVLTKVTLVRAGSPTEIQVDVTINGSAVVTALLASSTSEVSDAPDEAFSSGQQIAVTISETGSGDATSVAVCLYIKMLGRA